MSAIDRAIYLSVATTDPKLFIYYSGIGCREDYLHTVSMFINCITKGGVAERITEHYYKKSNIRMSDDTVTNKKHPDHYTLHDWIANTGAIVFKHVVTRALYKKSFDNDGTIYYTGRGCNENFFHTRKEFCRIMKCSYKSLPFVVEKTGAMVLYCL